MIFYLFFLLYLATISENLNVSSLDDKIIRNSVGCTLCLILKISKKIMIAGYSFGYKRNVDSLFVIFLGHILAA